MPEDTNTIIQSIVITSAIFILVAAFVITYVLYFKEKKSNLIAEKDMLSQEYERQLERSRIEVQESTYSSLSKELHDNIGQLLSTAKMLLGLTERTLPNPPDTLITANATVAKAITELRALSKSLDKEWLELFRFADNLETEIARINASNRTRAEFVADDHISLSSGEQIILFRIVQEAIQNAIKHAQPENLLVRMYRENVRFCITISDNGKGFEWNETSPGMGITNMKHRASLLKGEITWNSIRDKGTTVCIYLPYKEME